MKLQSTRTATTQGLKLLVYSQSGAGKTSLIPTLPNPVILSAEAGLLSIADANLPFIQIETLADLREAYQWLTKSEEGRAFDSVALDSISEIAEVVLVAEKKSSKDGRMAYGNMAEQMTDLIRAFRDLPGRNVYFTSKLEKTQDEMGRILYGPSMPGNKTAQLIPYFFDLVLALRVEKDADGKPMRVLQCQPDGQWLAKDRSGKLPMWAEPDLGGIIQTIKGEK